jgi:hypothetical protein
MKVNISGRGRKNFSSRQRNRTSKSITRGFKRETSGAVWEETQTKIFVLELLS